MNFKGITKRLAAIFFVLVIFVFNSSFGVSERDARLKNSLENDHLYLVLSTDFLGLMMSKNKSTFKERYDDKFVAFYGTIRYNSIADNHKMITVYDNNNYGVKVDTSSSAIKSIVDRLNMGDHVIVYGQVDSSEIDAEYIVVNPSFELSVESNVFYPNKVYSEEAVKDLAKNGHVTFHLPLVWKDEYVMGRLTNNDVNGYQFFLNAISPQNLNYPENFYIFYFNYETYLNYVKKGMDSFDIEDIEELVIDNILGGLSGSFKIDISTLKLSDGKKYDYCTTTYKPADGNDYRLEFIFKHDSTGFVCMLYLYYPNDSAVNHLQDVTYVVQTLEN